VSASGVSSPGPEHRGRGSAPAGAAHEPRTEEPSADRGAIAVFIVSDVRLYRDGLSDLLDRVDPISVVGAVAGAEDAVERVRELQPDVVLLDTRSGGVGAARDLLQAAPGSRVVAIATPEAEEDVIALAEAGVIGYVTRDESLDDLATTIEGVARDEMVCSPWIATVLVRRVQALAAERPRPTHGLTAREAEILELVAQGLSNKEIAARLYIEVTTVKNHVHNILEKLGVSRREEAVARVQTSVLPGRPL
jgi:two-component system nitrate/nitrite response regulator NarL